MEKMETTIHYLGFMVKGQGYLVGRLIMGIVRLTVWVSIWVIEVIFILLTKSP